MSFESFSRLPCCGGHCLVKALLKKGPGRTGISCPLITMTEKNCHMRRARTRRELVSVGAEPTAHHGEGAKYSWGGAGTREGATCNDGGGGGRFSSSGTKLRLGGGATLDGGESRWEERKHDFNHQTSRRHEHRADTDGTRAALMLQPPRYLCM